MNAPQAVAVEKIGAVCGAPLSDCALRANTYGLLAALLSAAPTEEMLDVLAAIEVPEEPGNGLAPAWRMLGLAARRTKAQAVADEYHALFIGITRGEVVPYGSWYLTGFLMDRPLARLRADLIRLGFERQADVHEPEDHAASLCEVMGLLLSEENDAQAEDAAKAFFAEHLAPWLEMFFADLQEAGSAALYRAVGYLGQQFVQLERRYWALPA